jgi:PAS domain S-box-containing protein
VKYFLYKSSLFCLLILLSLNTHAQLQKSPVKRILLLHSWHYGNRWALEIESGIEKEREKHHNSVEIFSEYMSTDLSRDTAYQQYHEDYIVNNYKNMSIDKVVAIGQPAIELASNLKKTVFKDASLLRIGLPVQPDIKNRKIINAVRNTTDLIVQNRPNLNYLVLISGKSKDSIFFGSVALQALKKYKLPCQIIVLDGQHLSSAEIIKRIQSYPPGGAILVTQWMLGREKKYSPPTKLYKQLCSVSPSPVFCLTDYPLGTGVIGGRMFRGEDLGKNIAVAAINNAAFKMPQSNWIFDERALHSWDMSRKSLPANSIVRYHKRSFGEKYFKYIIAFTIVFVLLFTTLILFVFNYLRRRRVEAVFGTIFEETPNAIVVFDISGFPQFANRSMLKLLGITDFEQMQEFNLFIHLLTPEQSESVNNSREAQKIATVMNLDDAKKIWLPNTAASGKLTLEISVRRLVLHNNSSYVAIINDVSTTRDLILRMELLEAAISRSAVAVLLINPDHSLHYINYAASEWFSINRNACDKHKVDELLSGNQKDLKELQRVFTERYSSFTAQFKTGVGSLFTAAVHGSIVSVGGRKMTCLFIEDITMRLRAQEDLRESEETLRLAVMAADLGLFDWDIRAQKINFSAASAAYFSSDADSITIPVNDWEARIVEEDRMVALQKISDCLKGNRVEYVSRYRLRTRDGSIRNIIDTGSVIEHDSQGKPLRVVGTQRDETEQKMWELKLLDAKRKAEENDRLKTFFLSNISHEIRTPLNGVLGFARLLSEAIPGSEDCNKYMEMVSSSAEMLLKLISDIIDFARLESGELQLSKSRTNANGLMRELLDEFHIIIKEEKEDKVELYCLPGLADEKAEILTDHKRLKQVMHCLLTNAIKFTDTGRIEFGYSADSNAFLEFYVRDTGIGITPGQQAVIFEFFRQGDGSDTRRHGGTGLGLALAKKLVEMMGGIIWVESDADKGTTLKFTIPR